MFYVWHLHGSCRGSLLKRSAREGGMLGGVVDRPQLQAKGENTGFKSKVITETLGGWGKDGLSWYSPTGQTIRGRQM